VDLIGVFVREIATIVAYALVFAGVYKLFQISTDLTQIKELLKDRSRATPSPVAPPPLDPAGANFRTTDDAAEYAEKLLRAVNAESRASTASPSLHDDR
jgi:hypothetical protein